VPPGRGFEPGKKPGKGRERAEKLGALVFIGIMLLNLERLEIRAVYISCTG
jgi:hypothetical protein